MVFLGQGFAAAIGLSLVGCHMLGLCRFLSSRRLAFFSKFEIFFVPFCLYFTGHRRLLWDVVPDAPPKNLHLPAAKAVLREGAAAALGAASGGRYKA